MLGQITDPGQHMNDPDRDPDGSSPCRPKGGQARPQDFANENKPWSIRAPRAPPDPRRHRLHERFERPVPTWPDTDPLAVPAHSPERPVSRPERTSTADHTRRDTHRRLHSARRSTGGEIWDLAARHHAGGTSAVSGTTGSVVLCRSSRTRLPRPPRCGTQKTWVAWSCWSSLVPILQFRCHHPAPGDPGGFPRCLPGTPL